MVESRCLLSPPASRETGARGQDGWEVAVPQESSVRLNQVGSDSSASSYGRSDGASLHTAPVNTACLLCSREINDADVYLPVYVEAWIVGNVHERCYDARVEGLLQGMGAGAGSR